MLFTFLVSLLGVYHVSATATDFSPIVPQSNVADQKISIGRFFYPKGKAESCVAYALRATPGGTQACVVAKGEPNTYRFQCYQGDRVVLDTTYKPNDHQWDLRSHVYQINSLTHRTAVAVFFTCYDVDKNLLWSPPVVWAYRNGKEAFFKGFISTYLAGTEKRRPCHVDADHPVKAYTIADPGPCEFGEINI